MWPAPCYDPDGPEAQQPNSVNARSKPEAWGLGRDYHRHAG